jgi:deoxyinosine 3'endonuclease (endonuclease V)
VVEAICLKKPVRLNVRSRPYLLALRTRITHLLEVLRKIAARVDLKDSYSTEFVAGVDQAFVDDRIISGAVVLGPSLDVIGRATCTMRQPFPIYPDYFHFEKDLWPSGL